MESNGMKLAGVLLLIPWSSKAFKTHSTLTNLYQKKRFSCSVNFKDPQKGNGKVNVT